MACLAIFISLLASFAAASSLTATTSAGDIQGGLCAGDGKVKFFKSIPYAKPPTGNLRFQPSQPYTDKYPGGSLNGTVIPPACIQFGDLFAEDPPYSEDCLYLDIWAPIDAEPGSALPVKVWVYGGSNTAGGISDPIYDGCNAAAPGVVFVSINYRLGPLGFLALASAGIAGNQGITDIITGLQWVQDNIKAFGGDPDKVLLFGQSAGATDVFTVASLPEAPKVVKAAIMESGGGRDIPLNVTAQALGVDFVNTLNCSLSDSQCLKDKSISDIQWAFNNTPSLNSKTFPLLEIGSAVSKAFQPHVDGKIIPNQPSEVGVQVPSILGAASEEGSIFTLLQFADAPKGPASASASDYHTFVSQNFGPAASMIEQEYPVSAFNSTPFPAFYAISTVIGYSNYICTAHRGLNTTKSNGRVPVWTYRFSHTPHCPWIPSLPMDALALIGPTHTSDIPFVFGHTTPLPTESSNCSMTADERALSNFMMDAWTSMAVNGEPKGDWPEYMNSSQSQGINFGSVKNETSAFPVAGYVDYTACSFWDQVNQILRDEAANSTATGSNSTSTHATNSGSSIGRGLGLLLGQTILWLVAIALL